MGISCQFCVTQPTNGVFTPGSTVHGTIKYAFKEEAIVKKITVSFQGLGKLQVIETGGFDSSDNVSESNAEDYVSFKNNVFYDEKGLVFSPGQYETAFRYELPENVPSSFDYKSDSYGSQIICKIAYSLRIDFEILNAIKTKTFFENEIKVVSDTIPRSPVNPLICGKRKKLFRLFSKNEDTVNLKACINNSVVVAGSKAEIVCEVENKSGVFIETIETKLVEILTFYNNEKEAVKVYTTDVKDTDSKTSCIKSSNTVEVALEVDIPASVYGIYNSKVVSKEYIITIIARFPIPFVNLTLKVPVRIGNTVAQLTPNYENENTNAPAFYWGSTNLAEHLRV